MTRTTLILPPSLRARAKHLARQEGLSFGEFMRRALAAAVAAREASARDPLFETVPYPKGLASSPPRDGSVRHAEYRILARKQKRSS